MSMMDMYALRRRSARGLGDSSVVRGLEVGGGFVRTGRCGGGEKVGGGGGGGLRI